MTMCLLCCTVHSNRVGIVSHIGRTRARKLKVSGILMNRGKSSGWEFGKKPK